MASIEPKRVAIVGAHGTGKTTLAEDLVEELRSSGLIAKFAEEPIRSVPRTNESDETYFLKLLEAHFARMYATDCDYLLLDRSLIDFTTYLSAENIPVPGVLSLARTLLPTYMKSIDFILKTPIEFSIEADGRRPVVTGFQHEVDRAITRALDDLERPYTIVTGNPGARLIRSLHVLGIPGRLKESS